jgi:hypothetical protein
VVQQLVHGLPPSAADQVGEDLNLAVKSIVQERKQVKCARPRAVEGDLWYGDGDDLSY